MPENRGRLSAVAGTNWGDEGKGRIVDMLASESGVVVRYQGGNNAGHTVINDKGRFILNLLPSGILEDGAMNVMGPGMVVDLEHLDGEIARLREAGVHVGPDNLAISDRAVICMPYHPRQDVLEEERLGSRAYGSTRRGIAPVYADKHMKKVLRMGDLLYPGTLAEKVAALCEWKDLLLSGGYGQERLDPREVLDWLGRYGSPLVPLIRDTGLLLEEEIRAGRPVLFEAQLGALRDVDFGIVPYTSSSSTLAAYAPIGAGIPGEKLDSVLGVMKAYSTCVGEGPFVAEMHGEEAERLRAAGGEYGAATGRPRRVGPFDAVASRHGCRLQGADELALTKLDVLGCLDEIPVCVAYETEKGRTEDFPSGDLLASARPVLETLPGWGSDIGDARSWEELPQAARSYVRWIEDAVGAPVRYVSVGPRREAYLEVPRRGGGA